MDTGMLVQYQIKRVRVVSGYLLARGLVTKSVQSLNLIRNFIDVVISVIIIGIGQADNIHLDDQLNVMETHV